MAEASTRTTMFLAGTKSELLSQRSDLVIVNKIDREDVHNNYLRTCKYRLKSISHNIDDASRNR